MKLSFRRPQEDPETEGQRLRERADAYGHKQTIRRIQEAAERRERAEESARLRREKAETRRQRRVERAERRAVLAAAAQKHGDAIGRRLILILPLLLVNSFAAFGQAGFAHDHFGWKIYAVIGFAATLESIALYIGYHAHAALMAGDSAMKLRLSSYLAGAVIGGLNYDHYAGSNGKPTALAVTFGLLSLMSPFLWAMHGRYKNRRRLEQLGLVDERAPHFSAAKWLHFPWQTLGALRYGIAHNLTDPSAAWVGYQRQRAEARAGRRLGRLWRWLVWDERPQVRVTVARTVTYTVSARKERVRLYWVPGQAAALTVGPPNGSEVLAPGGSQTGPSIGSGTGLKSRSRTQTDSRSQTGPGTRSGTQVPDRDGPGSETQHHDGSETGPKRGSRKRSKTGPKTKVSDRVAEAQAADTAYLAEHGRHIPAEKLARALRIAKPAALDLVKQIRGGHIDIAK
jgi:hypothetical protein